MQDIGDEMCIAARAGIGGAVSCPSEGREHERAEQEPRPRRDARDAQPRKGPSGEAQGEQHAEGEPQQPILAEPLN